MRYLDEAKAMIQLTVERDEAARELAEARQENERLRRALQFAQSSPRPAGALTYENR